VPDWKFPGERVVARNLALAKKKAELQEFAIRRMPANDRTRTMQSDLAKLKSGIESLQNFTDLYRAYVQTEIIFDDANSRALNAALPAKVRDDRGFDVERIDWEDYLQNVHFPAITEMTNAFRRRKQAATRAAAPKAKKPLPQRSDVVAVFDLEGTVVDSNIVEQYLWVRSAGFRKAAWPGEVVRLLASVGTYLRAERRDRGEFIRAFLRRYAGMPVARLEKIVARGGYRNAMLSHLSADALRQIQAHKAAGHRTVLVTGSISLLAAPLADLFDEVVGSSMHEKDGVLTGYLAKPPLVDEARGAWLKQYADAHGLNLSQSYGYGDSHADLRWLELVGNPNAVNPDSELSREAHRRLWGIHSWKRGGSEVRRDALASTAAATAPAEPVAVAQKED
jgi:alcohol-forming fatty acyl-CoA reductase